MKVKYQPIHRISFFFVLFQNKFVMMMIMRLNNKVIPTGCSNGWYVVHLSFESSNVLYFHFMISLLHFSYFNAVCNHFYNCNKPNDKIFYNL